MALREFLKEIADAIRTKKKTTLPINAQDFVEEIESIETSGGEVTLQEKNITKNGTYTPDIGYDGFSKVFVNVETVSSGDTLKTLLDTTKSTRYLFYLYNGTSVDGLIPYNATSNVTNMSEMFQESKISSVPLFDTSNVTNMSSMFDRCYSLKSVPLFDTSNVTNMVGMFYQSALTSVLFFNTSNVTRMSNMFEGCTSLKTVKFVGVGAKLTSTSRWFNGCTSLELIDFRGATGVPTLSSTNAFTNVPSTCKVVIPDTLYDTWVNSTNWATISVIYVKESDYVEA